MNNKFTHNFKAIIKHAQEMAHSNNQGEMSSVHVFKALLEHKGSLAFELMHKLGVVELEKTQQGDTIIQTSDSETERAKETIEVSQEVKRIIQRSVSLAARFSHSYVGSEHLLLSLVQLDEANMRPVLERSNITPTDLEKQLEAVLRNTSKFDDITSGFSFSGGALPSGKSTLQKPPSISQQSNSTEERLLDFFAVDLTDKELQEGISPVIGREQEIERIVQILARRDKNNPVLLGDPGVGKTAIIEGLAKRIIEGDVPEILLDKRIYSLDLSLLVAGAMYRGEFESRLKQLIDEIREDDESIIFVDELHTIVGAGAAAGSLDAANILKPALARGEIRLIGATTYDEYKKHIEADAALDRRLQPLNINEPTEKETIKILEGIKQSYEQHHGVAISTEAIRAATELSQRFIIDKFLPDKAIDLIDEASARVQVKQGPTEEHRKLSQLKKKLEEVTQLKHQAVEQENFPRALEIKEQERRIQKSITAVTAELEARETKCIGTVSATHIAELISQVTRIPVGELIASEAHKLRNLSKQLSRHVIGQEEAITSLSQAIKRSKTGFTNPDQPMGSFMFLGPSGVGKTETAKVLAREVFRDPKALIRFDMSEFVESFNVSRLIGAPAGYVGYREGGQLTEKVRRNPYSVVLFDEIEKAHSEVFNILLQILDEGYVTDSTGKKVDFRNTLVILTSNIGLTEFNENAQIGFSNGRVVNQQQKNKKEYQQIKNVVLASLKQRFRPELLNRLDKIIVFKPLTKKHIQKITSNELDRVVRQIKEKANVIIDKKTIAFLAEKSYLPKEGARAVKRVVQDLVVDPLADHILDGNVPPGSNVGVTVKNNKVTFI